MKRSAITRLCIWAAVAFVLMVVLVTGLGGVSFGGRMSDLFGRFNLFSAGYSYDNAEQYTAGNAAFAGSSIKEIDISWVAGDVLVATHDGNEIEISETASTTLNDNQLMRYRVKGDKLTIQYSDSNSGVRLFNTSSKSLTVRIPRNMNLVSLSVDNVSSSVHVDLDGMEVESLDAETVSGSMALYNIHGRDLRIRTTSGSVDVVGTFTTVDGEAISGSQTYNLYAAPDELDAESVSGSITLNLPQDASFTAELDTVSGSLNTNLGEKDGRHRAIAGSGRGNFDFETVSGSINIQYDSHMDAQPKPTTPAKPEKDAKPTATVTPVPANTSGGTGSSQRSF